MNYVIKCSCVPFELIMEGDDIASFFYVSNDPAISKALPSYVVTPDCGNEVQHTFSYVVKLSSGLVAPPEFTVTGVPPMFVL